jgi:hypothetical protein
MTVPNPYAAPQAPFAPQQPGYNPYDYAPLGWRTLLAALSVLGVTVFDVAMRGAQVMLGGALTSSKPDLGAALLIGVAGLAVLVTSVASWVFVPIWFHRASSNLRGLGRHGMAFSPGASAGWFFVPIANLWKPVQAMVELWKASDPAADEGSWFTSRVTGVIAVWWATYLLSGFISSMAFFLRDDPASAATVGLASTFFRVVAAVALVLLMRGVSARQESVAARLGGQG